MFFIGKALSIHKALLFEPIANDRKVRICPEMTGHLRSFTVISVTPFGIPARLPVGLQGKDQQAEAGGKKENFKLKNSLNMHCRAKSNVVELR